MVNKLLLMRALHCIEVDGYLSGKSALIKGDVPTSSKIFNSLTTRPVPDDLDLTYDAIADDILKWLPNAPSNDFMDNCKKKILDDGVSPETKAKYIATLPNAYSSYMESIKGLDKVTAGDQYAGSPGDEYDSEASVLRYKVYDNVPSGAYAKVFTVDQNGRYVTYTVSPNKSNKLTVPPAGSKIRITGKVYRNNAGNPFETVLHKVKVKLI